jgi:hypothetical protein
VPVFRNSRLSFRSDVLMRPPMDCYTECNANRSENACGMP